MNIATLRIVILIILISMLILALVFLRRRKLSLGAHIFWSLFALLLPVIGPFLVIVLRPGKPNQNRGEP